MVYPFKNNPTKKKIIPIQIKKNQPKLKLTRPTQIKSKESFIFSSVFFFC